jgi:hypothetical protein
MTTKAQQQTTQVNEAAKTGANLVMSQSKLSEIINKAIAADVAFEKATKTHKSIYTECSAALRSGIESGIFSDNLAAEYDRRRTEYVKAVIAARFKDYPATDKAEVTERARLAMMQGIKMDNSNAEWVSPRSEKERDEKKAKAEAERAKLNRVIEKKVKETIKAHPEAANDDKALKAIRAQVKTEVMSESKEEREARALTQKFLASEQKFLDGLAAYLSKMPDAFQADVRDCQLRGAALIASLMEIRTQPE